MNRTWRMAVGVLAALALMPGLAPAQGKAFSLGKNGDVELTTAASIGSTTLPPGQYRFQYVEEDGRHDLAVRMRPEERSYGGRRYGVGPGTEVARIPCLLMPRGQKIRQTSLVLKTEPDGTTRITEIRIRGEAASHVIAREPKG